MGCCGKKRQNLTNTYAKASMVETNTAPGRRVNRNNIVGNNAVFKYTGSSSLDVKIPYNRHSYHFSSSAPEQTVAAEDAGMIRGYPELIEVRK
jgi:hypothetical protein